MEIVFGVIVLLASLFMVVTIMLQSSNVKDLGAVAGQMDSYFSKNKAKTIEAKLALGTKVAAAIFVVAAIALLLV